MNNNKQLYECYCGHIFDAEQLAYPLNLLDDDYADYGGDCPECGENSLDGKIWDYEPAPFDAEIADMRVNQLLGNERDYIESRAVNVACVGLLMFILTIFSLAVMLPDETSGRVSSGAVQGVIR